MAQEFQTKISSVRIKDSAAYSLMMADGMQNVLTGVGGSLDPVSNSFYYIKPLNQQMIEASFRSSWISDKIHRVPPRDMVRAWRSWKSKNTDITLIEKEERRIGLRNKVEDALIWARLYGGSVLVLGINDEDPATPLNINTVKRGSLKYIHVLSRHQINIPDLVLDPGSQHYLEPSMYQINAGNGVLINTHPSRVVRFLSKKLPESAAYSTQGWGDPLLQTIESAIVNSDTIQGSFAAIASRAREDTVGIPGLTSIASTTEGENALKKRILTVAAFRSMFHVNLVDTGARKDDAAETWTQWQANFSGMPDVMTTFLQFVAGAADMPLTRLGGMSPGGMNSTGDSDLENYHQTIDAGQELDLRPRLEAVDEILVRSAIGEMPPELYWDYNPLKIDSEKTRADIAKTYADATKIYADTGTVPSEVLMKGVKDQLIESGQYPSIEEAYADYEAAGNVLEIEEPEPAANDNVLAAATEGLVAQGMSARDAATQAVRLCDAIPRTLYVSRRLINADDVIAWYADKGLTVTVPAEKMHVTIVYSKQPVDWLKIDSDDWRDAEFTVKAGGARLHEKLGANQDVVALVFGSSQLTWRHEEMLRGGASSDWDDYTPHLTLTYEGADVSLDGIEPYRGELRFSYERWEELNEDWNA